MAKTVSSFNTPGTGVPCRTSSCMLGLSGAREVATRQRGCYRSARSATRSIAAARSVVTRGIWRVRKPGRPRWERTSRGSQVSGRAAHASRVSHAGQVLGFHQATRGAWTPSAVSQRDRGPPWTAGGRRTRGRTTGRPGVTSTIWRGPTRRTACTPAWTRRARWASEHRPRSATSPSSGAHTGCPGCPWASAWVRRRGPRPASGAPRCPPGRAPGGVPRGRRTPAAAPSIGQTRPGGPGDRASSPRSHRRDRADGQALARRPGRLAAPQCRSARGGERRGAVGVSRGLARRLPRCTASPTTGGDGDRRCGQAQSVTGITGWW
jgi:hypothetical protein